MQYVDAIKWLKEHDVKKDDGTYYEFGEVMTERNTEQQLKTKLTQTGLFSHFF